MPVALLQQQMMMKNKLAGPQFPHPDNILPDPGFATGVMQAPYNTIYGGTARFTTDPNLPVGTQALEITYTTGAAPYVEVITRPYDNLESVFGPAAAGETWRVELWYRSVTLAPSSITLWFFPKDAAGARTGVHSFLRYPSAPSAEYGFFSADVVLPAGTTQMASRFDIDGPAGVVGRIAGWQMYKLA